MPYRIAGIDVDKKMLAVVVADVHVEGEYQLEGRHFGSIPEQLQLLAEWLLARRARKLEVTAFPLPMPSRAGNAGMREARRSERVNSC